MLAEGLKATEGCRRQTAYMSQKNIYLYMYVYMYIYIFCEITLKNTIYRYRRASLEFFLFAAYSCVLCSHSYTTAMQHSLYFY